MSVFVEGLIIGAVLGVILGANIGILILALCKTTGQNRAEREHDRKPKVTGTQKAEKGTHYPASRE